MKRTLTAICIVLLLTGCAGFQIDIKARYTYIGEDAAKIK